MAKKTVAGSHADPTLPKVPITVDGTTYHLCFDFNALAEAESRTGFNLLVAIDFNGINASQFRALLYASLLKFQPEITIEEAGALIRSNNAAELTQALVKTYSESSPEPKADAAKNVETPGIK